MPWHFCQFSHFFAGGRVAMPVLIRAPWRHPGLHMSGYALKPTTRSTHPRGLETLGWLELCQTMFPNLLFFWVYFIISHQSKLFPLKRIWDVQISLTLLNKNNFNGDRMLVCQKLIQIGRFIHLVLKIFINLPRLEIPRQFIPDYVRDTILESGVECYINSAATKVALFAYITCQSALHIFTGSGAFCKSFTLPWELIWRPTQRFLSANFIVFTLIQCKHWCSKDQ